MNTPRLLSDPRRKPAVQAISSVTDLFSLQRSKSLDVASRAKALLHILAAEAVALRRAEAEWEAQSDYAQAQENAKLLATARKRLGLPPGEDKDLTAVEAFETLVEKQAEKKVEKTIREMPGWRKGERKPAPNLAVVDAQAKETAAWVAKEEKYGRPR